MANFIADNIKIFYDKNWLGTGYPLHCNRPIEGGAGPGSSDLLRAVESLITPELLVSRFLLGLSLRSPITKKEITKVELQDFINMAVAQVELELNIDVYPRQIQKSLPFDKSFSEASTMALNLLMSPVQSIQVLAIVTPSQENIFVVPADWISTANLDKGIINRPFASIFNRTPLNVFEVSDLGVFHEHQNPFINRGKP